jgi:hypothetical protein
LQSVENSACSGSCIHYCNSFPTVLVLPASLQLNLAPRSAAAPAEAGDGASKSSVFGAARPREEVLKEQGRDPLKEELAAEHAAVGR